MEASSTMDASEATEAGREAVTLLTRAADLGEVLEIRTVQSELGLGYADARTVMGQLVEAGIATEEAPGEWAAAEQSESGEPRVEVDVPGEEQLERDDGAAARALQTLMPPPTVRLPRAAVEAMDETALGALVKASLPSDGDWFLMEIG